MKQALARLFTPHATVPRGHIIGLVVFQVVLAIAVWVLWPLQVIPKPWEVLTALGNLWTERGLGQELKRSFITCVEATLIASVFSLAIGYLEVLAFFKPVGQLVSKFRFLGLVGLTFIFTLVTGGGHALKLSVLVFGLSVFIVPGVRSVVGNITKEELDHARTLRMGPWRSTYEVVVFGKLDAVLEVIRQNGAIAWMMLTVVEGLVRSEGGVGALLLTQSKFLKLPEIYAIQLTIIIVAIAWDEMQGALKKALCPWAQIGLERR